MSGGDAPLTAIEERGIVGKLKGAPPYMRRGAVEGFNAAWLLGSYMPPTDVDETTYETEYDCHSTHRTGEIDNKMKSDRYFIV